MEEHESELKVGRERSLHTTFIICLHRFVNIFCSFFRPALKPLSQNPSLSPLSTADPGTPPGPVRMKCRSALCLLGLCPRFNGDKG